MSTIATRTHAPSLGRFRAEIAPSANGRSHVPAVALVGPAGAQAPLQVHDEDERFFVLEGDVTLFVGEEELRAAAGCSLLAPRGRPHALRADTDVRIAVTTTTGRFERFLRRIARPAGGAGLPFPERPPTPEEAAALTRAAAEHGIEILGPPGMLPRDL